MLSWIKRFNARQELEAGAFCIDSVQNNTGINAIHFWKVQFNTEQSHFNYSTRKHVSKTKDLLFPEIKEF